VKLRRNLTPRNVLGSEGEQEGRWVRGRVEEKKERTLPEEEQTPGMNRVL